MTPPETKRKRIGFLQEKEKLLAEIERLMKDLKSERLNEMLKQDFRISKIIYDEALKIAKEARDKGNN